MGIKLLMRHIRRSWLTCASDADLYGVDRDYDFAPGDCSHGCVDDSVVADVVAAAAMACLRQLMRRI